MAQRTCTIEGCDRAVRHRGWCNKHYMRWWRSGSTELRRPTFEERLWRRVHIIHPLGCWWWTGYIAKSGYGMISRNNRNTLAHRAVYTELCGLIPAGLELDHLCRNPACVNPDHLEPVLPYVNNSRSQSRSARFARVSHCPKGHPYDEENTYVRIRKNGRPSRECRACSREKMRNRYKAGV